MRVVVLRHHAKHADFLSQLLGVDYTVDGIHDPSDADLRSADVVVSTSLTVTEAQQLRARLVQVPSAGYDKIALASLPGGCHVANVYGHDVPLTEYVMHAILDYEIYGHIQIAFDQNRWAEIYFNRPLRGELFGKRLTLVGVGHIGLEVAKRAKAFGMHVTGVSRNGGEHDMLDSCVSSNELDNVLPPTDVLVLCCPLNDSTRNLMDARRLGLMPKHALLINVSRAEVVNEQALFNTLSRGAIGRAVLDVWYRYPQSEKDTIRPANLPFEALPNVRLTPHIAGWSRGLIERRYQFVAENIKRLRKGATLLNQVQ